MAYAPTTWDANDVITKDKLNKIEQGINTASKLSGTDIDTDKDWNGKSITNVGTIAASQYVGGSNLLMQASASDTLVNASEGLVSVTGTTPTKVKEIWLSPQNSVASTYRIKFNLAATDNVTVRGAIYVNGVQRGTLREAVNMSYTEFSEDIPGLKGGDLVQLYLWGTYEGWTAQSTYFRIYADFAPVAFSATPSNITTL